MFMGTGTYTGIGTGRTVGLGTMLSETKNRFLLWDWEISIDLNFIKS